MEENTVQQPQGGGGLFNMAKTVIGMGSAALGIKQKKHMKNYSRNVVNCKAIYNAARMRIIITEVNCNISMAKYTDIARKIAPCRLS